MPSPVGSKRKRQRERVRLYAGLKAAYDQARGELVDLSEVGMRLKLEKSVLVKVNEPVDIYIQHMGIMTGKVKWQRFKMVGLELDQSTNTYAQTLAAIRKFKQKQV